MRYADAIAEAVAEVLAADERVVLIGGGWNRLVTGSVEQAYAARIVSPPIAELAYCGVAIGAAMSGLRPIVDFGTASFSYEAIPQIVNEAAVVYANSNGQTSAPVMFHMLYGLRGGGAAQHSGSPAPWYWNTPGLQVAMPGTPGNFKGLFRWAALRSEGPTVFMNHRLLFDTRGPVPEGEYEVPFGRAEIVRAGPDATVVACGIQVVRALEAADVLAREDGIQVEVIDPRTLQPLDLATILSSARKTGRVVVTDESHDLCGVAAGLAALIADEAFDALQAPIKRVSTRHVPVPYAQSMEEYIRPTAQRIVFAVRDVIAVTRRRSP